MPTTVVNDPLCDDDRIYLRVKDPEPGITIDAIIEKIDPNDPDPIVTIDDDLICIERTSDDCAGYIVNTILNP